MPKQLFRYAFCGSFAVFVDIVTFFISYNFIFQKNDWNVYGLTMKAQTASLFLAFSISGLVGFLLQKYITFTNSNLRGRVQLLRYIIIVIFCLLLNYFGIKLLVEKFDIFPTVAKIIVTPFIVTFSYFSQRYFSFKEKK